MYTDDSGVIGAILQGDRDRYEELVQKYKRMVYGIAWSHLGDRDLSEDVAQETFVKAFSYLGTLRNPDLFPGWLAQIARNVCNTFGRRAKREKALAERWVLESDAAQADEADRKSLEEQLRESFAALPAIHREALTIFYLEDKSLREATAVLGISETALKARLHRARIALRAQLEHRLEDTFESLEPSRDFTRSVLGALPLAPNGALGVGGVTAVLGKLVAGLGFMLWMVLAQVSLTSGIILWFTASEVANFKDTPENQFRRAAIKRTAVSIAVVMAVTMAITTLLLVRLETRAYFKLLSLLYVVIAWRTWRSLRVNTTPVMLGNAFFVAAVCLTLAGIGFLNMPTRVLTIVWMVVMVVVFLTNRRRPTRGDYDLFLRAATGGLGEVPDDEQPLPNPLTQAQLRAFARLLGNQWLVRDYVLQGDAIRLILTGARQTIRFGLAPGSSILINSDGACTAYLAPSDLNVIRQMTGSDPSAEDLQATVCRVVRHTVRCFVQGDQEAARSAVTAQSDETIFKQNTGWTGAFIILFAVVIGLFTFMILTGR